MRKRNYDKIKNSIDQADPDTVKKLLTVVIFVPEVIGVVMKNPVLLMMSMFAVAGCLFGLLLRAQGVV